MTDKQRCDACAANEAAAKVCEEVYRHPDGLKHGLMYTQGYEWAAEKCEQSIRALRSSCDCRTESAGKSLAQIQMTPAGFADGKPFICTDCGCRTNTAYAGGLCRECVDRTAALVDAKRWRMLRKLSHHIVLQIIQSDWSEWNQRIDDHINLDSPAMRKSRRHDRP